MKRILFSFVTILLLHTACHASADTSISKIFVHIIQLVQSDNAKELSKLIAYPLKRENPLPDIENANDFIARYKTIFDSSFKALLKQYNDSDIFEHNFSYGLVGGNFTGQLWINEDGKVSGIETSKTEEKDRQALKAKIKTEMNASVNSWNENVIVARSGKLLIRIDRTDKGLRYVCWSNGRTIKDTPDIILYNGVEEAKGTMGGWTYTFTNSDWMYIVDKVEMCENIKDCGLFLELFYKGNQKNKTELTEIK